MTDPLDEVLLDDRYWLSRAKTILDRAITSREEAAAKLLSGIAWFWTVYSTVVVASMVISRKASLSLALALVAPAALMIVAYLQALRVIYPVDVEFDPRSPEEIQDAYRVALERKRKLLSEAVFFTGLAGVSTLVAIFVAAWAPGLA